MTFVVSFDRVVSVKFPTMARKMCTLNGAMVQIIMVFLYVTSWSIFTYVFVCQREHDCSVPFIYMLSTRFSSMVPLVCDCLIMIWLSTVLGFSTDEHLRFQASLRPNPIRERNLRLQTTRVLSIATGYCLCQIPSMILWMWAAEAFDDRNELLYLMDYLSLLFQNIGSAVKPLLYILTTICITGNGGCFREEIPTFHVDIHF